MKIKNNLIICHFWRRIVLPKIVADHRPHPRLPPVHPTQKHIARLNPHPQCAMWENDDESEIDGKIFDAPNLEDLLDFWQWKYYSLGHRANSGNERLGNRVAKQSGKL
jgi:hypothetical protein